MASFSMVRAGLLGISLMALSGCGEDPQLSTLQQRLLDLKKELAQSTADQTQASATSNALQAELRTLKATQSASEESMHDRLKLVREALEATRGQLAAAHRQVATSTSAMDAAKQDMATLQTAVNKARKSRFRNALKKMNLLIDDKKKDEALKFLPKLNSELMKIAKTGIIKKQNASRNVSRITKKISTI